METVALVLALVLALAAAIGLAALAVAAVLLLRRAAPADRPGPRTAHPSTLGSPRDPAS